ncbi:MAG TPA: NAD(P)H-binding protein [Pseudomonas sp.]|nr:NAD(P)H-binding protein [Pseudomonas sp.]
MRLAVFGATGATGRHVVSQALAAGHEVIAIARDPGKVAPRPNLIVRAGDVLDAESLRESCRGAEVVISCIGPSSSPGAGAITNNLRPGKTMSIGTVNMVAAAEAAGVRRFVFQSGIGLSDGSEMTAADRWVLRLLWRPVFGAALRDKGEGERSLVGSPLDWVIVRPVGLKDAAAPSGYRAGPGQRVALFSALSFADCAACLLRAASEPGWTRQIVNVGPS